MLFVWRELGSEADVEFFSTHPIWDSNPFLKMPPGPLFTDEAASSVWQAIEDHLRLFPTVNIDMEPAQSEGWANCFQLTLESSVCVWWDIQSWVSYHVGGKFSRSRCSLSSLGLWGLACPLPGPGTRGMCMLAHLLVHSPLTPGLSEKSRWRRNWDSQHIQDVWASVRQLTLALEDLDFPELLHLHSDMPPVSVGGLWARARRLSVCWTCPSLPP